MPTELNKAYEPQAVEEKWYEFWLQQGCFTADPSSAKPGYSIVIPPPNVTGMLHMGHVLNNTIQDILSRKARMEGKEVLWLPGTDHAGIATQSVVERTLRKEGVMKHRDDLGREKFLEHVWAWKEKHGGIIIQQLKKLGCSCDWSRLRFTMDPAYSDCVQRVFVALFAKGLIYRGRRMVNWDPSARTALSDEEVDMIEVKGHLWHLRYPVLDQAGAVVEGEFVTVATTRPETMLGDEAVAVNPRDERHTHLIGRHVLLPLRNKPIPIIADEFVDAKFGTGCVKVTPAHDPNDHEMALRHNLPITVVIGPGGAMTAEAGPDYAGLDRKEARTAVISALTEKGLLWKTEDYLHNVGHSQRSGVPIEPYLSEQWFLKYPATAPATACVEPDRTLRFHPERWAKTYSHWMGNLRDWCISRQLWWGHRVPVWTRLFESATPAGVLGEIAALVDEAGPPEAGQTAVVIDGQPAPAGAAVLLETASQPAATAGAPATITAQISTIAPGLIQRLEAAGWTQDPDVLDTWFSSWLWPFATMGWPDKTATLAKFYPTTDLVTGPDIIFFWVARMIMAGYEFMGELPFRNVYFTGIIRDKLGRKMSKSLGNSPDPLDLISRFGADALRFGTMRGAPLGQDVLFDEKDVELGRNFCNKLWNACRFRQMQAGDVQAEIDPAKLSADDRWILLKLDQAIREITTAFTEYRFNEATQTLYRFFWSEYCDWYVEASKAVLHDPDPAAKATTLAVIDFVLSHTLRLFHPFLPFITEELWHGLGYHEEMPEAQGGRTIMFAPWPKPLEDAEREHYGLTEEARRAAEAKFELVSQGRNLRREANIPAGKKVRYVLKPAGELMRQEVEILRLLLNAEALDVDPAFEPKKGTPVIHGDLGLLFLPLEGLVDMGAEKVRLAREIEKIDLEIAKVRQKLGNVHFTSKAPPQVLHEHQLRLVDWATKRERVVASLQELG